MGSWSDIMRCAREAAVETLWPTRCALCDAPGEVLCDSCAEHLSHLDWWRACPRCGSPYGRVQCDMCNPVMLARIGRDELPFAGSASAMVFDDASGQLVRAYKDLGERRIAAVMADFMERMIAPAWDIDAITFIPATNASLRRRGFDHGEDLARALESRIGAPCVCALNRPSTRDQRSLSARERIANLNARFSPRDGWAPARRLLLVDDVFTTGATLCAATDALLAGGVECVYCLTFARV